MLLLTWDRRYTYARGYGRSIAQALHGDGSPDKTQGRTITAIIIDDCMPPKSPSKPFKFPSRGKGKVRKY